VQTRFCLVSIPLKFRDVYRYDGQPNEDQGMAGCCSSKTLMRRADNPIHTLITLRIGSYRISGRAPMSSLTRVPEASGGVIS